MLFSIVSNLQKIAISIENGKFWTKLFDKRDNFDFPIVNYPHMDSNIPVKPALGVYISQLIRFGKLCSKFSDFKERNLLITKKLLTQGYKHQNLVRTFKIFYLSYSQLLKKYNMPLKSYLKDTITLPIQLVKSSNLVMKRG